MKKINFFLVAAIVFLSCSSQKTEYSLAEFTLCTVCQVRLLTDKPQKEVTVVFDEIFAELKKLDSIFNANTENSELEFVNTMAGIESVEVSDELSEVLEFALFLAEKTGGAFNPAIGTLVKRWGIGFNASEPPSSEKITSALSFLDYKEVILTKTSVKTTDIAGNNKNCVFLKKAGMRLDLGGIAKGYAADCVAKIILNAGIENALIDIGGNIFALGKNMKNQDWLVGLKNPNIGESGIVASVKISGQSLVTSGNYERFFKYKDRIYHHILDSKTGYPVETNLNAVSILANSSLVADALSTACFVLGIEKSRELIRELNIKTKNDITAFFFYDSQIEVIGKECKEFSVFEPFKISYKF